MTQSQKTRSVVILFLLSAAFYLKSLAPTIIPGDSPELITSSYNLGIAHLSGYPLYLITSKIFAWLPLGEIAYRINLVNAVITAISVALIPVVLTFIIANSKNLILVGLALGLFWGLVFPVSSQAIISEVYPLLWLCLLITLLALHKQNYYLAALVAGLGINVHYAFILAIPGLLFWVKKSFWRTKKLLLIVFLVLAGMQIISYMPIRAVKSPTPSWDKPMTFKKLTAKLTLTDFEKRAEIKRGKSAGEYLTQLKYILSTCIQVFGLLLIVWCLGMWQFFKKEKFLAWGLSLICVVFILGLTHVSSYPTQAEAANLLPKFLALLFIVMLIPTGSGIMFLIERSPARWRGVVTWLFCILIPVWGFSQRTPSMRWNFLAFDYGQNLLNSLPSEKFYLLSSGDTSSFPLAYLKYVGNYLPQHEVTGSANFSPQKLQGQFPLHTTLQVDESNQPYQGYRLFFAAQNLNLPPDWPGFYRLRGVAQHKRFTDMMSQFTRSKYYLFRGLYYLQLDKTQLGLNEISVASKLTRAVAGEHYNYGVLLKNFGHFKMAEAEFRLFLEGFPHVLPGYYQLAKTYEELNQVTEALNTYMIIFQRNPRFADTAYRMGRLLVDNGNYQAALPLLQIAKEVQGSADVYNLLGVAYEETKQFDLAVNFYQKAIDLKPAVAGYYYNYAKVLDKINSPDYPKEWQKYLELVEKNNPR